MSEYRNKKVLIITYYWPPSGGSPVLRWLKFVKYLPENAWEPIIFTPLNPVPQAFDYSLLNDVASGVKVIKRKIKEPSNWFGFRNVKNTTQSTAFISEKRGKSIVNNIAIWIRGNMFIPDARCFWINPSARYLIKYVKSEKIGAIVSTGPPHSMHMIAYKVKKKTSIPWLADFRDPWTNIDYYKKLKLTALANRRHHTLEKKVLRTANAIITVSPTMTKEFEEMGCKKVFTITNGYDYSTEISKQKFLKFSILHVGSMPASRNPKMLWPVLSELLNEMPELKKYLSIELIGKVDYSILKDIEETNLTSYVLQSGHISNIAAIEKMKNAALLLLVINDSQNSKGILTNKFFEYMSASRPILAIGPTDGDVAKILGETKSGSIIDYNDKHILKNKLHNYFVSFTSGSLDNSSIRGIEKYSRKNLTQQLSKILVEIST